MYALCALLTLRILLPRLLAHGVNEGFAKDVGGERRGVRCPRYQSYRTICSLRRSVVARVVFSLTCFQHFSIKPAQSHELRVTVRADGNRSPCAP